MWALWELLPLMCPRAEDSVCTSQVFRRKTLAIWNTEVLLLYTRWPDGHGHSQMTCSLLLPSSFSASLPVSLLHLSSAPPISPRASWDLFRLPWICSGRPYSVTLSLVRSGRGEAETMDRRGCGAQALSEIAFARSLALEGLCHLLQVIEYPLFRCSRHSYPG